MIPLYYIDATAIANTLKPLISKDAALVLYAPTNTIILTDTKSNVRRLMGILDALDVESHKEELAVITLEQTVPYNWNLEHAIKGIVYDSIAE